ncbi:MAG TPA: class I SAM-dependent methyltransferase [Bryobacteraceae bacterium]|nr:class I SAM-dependent methyltransferase [Bryobacteraceae bacterium]
MMNPAEFANIARAEESFWWYRGMRGILSRLLDPLLAGRTPRHVLEAGCGTGYNALELQKRDGWRVFPLDLQMEGLAYARSMGLERLVQGDIAALPFHSFAFDAVVSLDVIVHFPRGGEDRPMAEFARVLAPGGLLVLRVSALDILRSRHSEFTCERQRFTRKRLIELAARHGIRVLRCTYANTILFPVALAKFRIWEPLTRQAPQSGVQPGGGWLNRMLELPLAAESIWLGAGLDLPVGQSLILAGEKIA